MLPPSDLVFTEKLFPNAPPPFAIRIVLGLRSFFLRLANRVIPPEILVFEQSIGISSTVLLGAVVRAGIAELLEELGPLDAKAIAKSKSLDADAVHRTLRALSNMGLFSMTDDGLFSNNAASRAIAGGKLSRSREWALYFSSPSNVAAWLDYDHVLRTGKNGFAHVHEKSVWDWFDAHEDEREMFAHAMMGLTVADAPMIASLYPFSDVKKLCDVGGGRGTLLSELLLRNPHMNGVLCEGAGVAESAKKLFVARAIDDRVEIVTGSFFEKVPEGCDAYSMKNILHDWDDARSKKILSVVRAAMKPGAKLLLCEMIVDRNSRDVIGTRADLQMMVVCDEGRERSVDEFRVLLDETKFRLARVFRSPTICVIEAEAV